jgi:ubiquinone biosynthesis protein COQ4
VASYRLRWLLLASLLPVDAMASSRFFTPYKLSLAQRAFLVPYFGTGALINPVRGDLVAGFGDVTAGPMLERLHAQMRSTPGGRELLKNKPLITEKDLSTPMLRGLPDGTFGRMYTAFMDHHGYSADERSIVRFMTNPELAYTMARYRQVHDFWHVLSGLPPTVAGEVALKCFEFRVTGLPVAALGGLLGQVKLDAAELSKLHNVYLPWAMRAGGACADLMSYPYERSLSKPVDQVRQELNFEPAPAADST